MDFALTDEQIAIRHAVQDLCAGFDDDYWTRKDREGGFPEDFYRAMAGAGWLGVAMPAEYGGAGLGIQEAALMMETVAVSGAGMAGASSIHMNVFGLHPVVVHGSDAQRARWLPPIISGEQKACFGVTEPNTGLNTLKLRTLAVRRGDRYVVNGQKIWISTAQVASKILLLARTTPLDQVTGPTQGLSLFYTDLDRSRVSVREIEKLGRKAVDSNELFIDGLAVPVEDRIGEEGKGFSYILHGLNPERVLLAAEATGLGRAALRRAAAYAGERIVFDRPIGQNQGVQHPLAERWVELEAAELLYRRAAWLYDQGQPCGAEANAAKFFCAEAGFRACETAVLTHGGMGYAKEYHVERYFREAMLPRIAPVSPQLILCYIAEKVLGLPKSY
ncbi:Acyl-CoA dehydrogenase fadE12 [Achromobacter denitrificans]|uniref:acyl-CoA dehydrogenase family protein n=1 Tax=Achromobacter denitrificans TaxID=32002 RepID=UPI000788FEBD|nr:acyl-CoA dehydrogenase family protein [Achromobacter denitrificans]OLU09371.1 acyl-CoA dehydrogenase [Achromobacter denitrificans]QKH41797.1 acyl-CoA/acyl-ACP dehydrogenase [Achromobacter denitrificans]QKH51059.1 acyl-CoA/acyl-ACP dehydrogenase [Achromobacter denitrificans]CAB3682799.1 Acyl-CoA dehydrogenase fadE12 [Achromobacter denitrificans]SUU24916.1 Acyl-CoA dehydrogenase fadE12 [Achromobacter denitrificans]